MEFKLTQVEKLLLEEANVLYHGQQGTALDFCNMGPVTKKFWIGWLLRSDLIVESDADFALALVVAEDDDKRRNAEHEEIRNSLRDTLATSGEWDSLSQAEQGALTSPAADQRPHDALFGRRLFGLFCP